MCLRGWPPESAAHIAEALKANTILAQLNLSDNKLEGRGAKVVADMLSVNKTLTSVKYVAPHLESCCQQPLTPRTH